ncbi:M42 family metallopeptidase [Candidatus Woesearchaeota archaeon]|nr:M42 family metallopeptidase [Candidatus Woesearchaeota archaeon]
MTIELLQRLIDEIGPSGNESTIREIIRKEIEKHVDTITIDKLGNLIAYKKCPVKGVKNPDKVMLAAHMDEIGLMVREISNDGKIKFSTIGGIDATSLVGQSVRIMLPNNKFACWGVVSFLELQEGLEITKLVNISDLYVDTGLDRKGLKKLGVDVGCYLVAKHSFRVLGNEGIISGKALDDRLGCYILIELIKRLKHAPLNIYFVFTVQEEIGLYGAQVSTYKIEPDWGIAVDTTNTEDADEFDKLTIMGKGPVVLMKDAEIITNRCLDDALQKIAQKNKINVQFKVDEEGTTDATKIMISRGGIPSTVIAIPVRNIHSTIGIACMQDIRDAIKILEDLLKKPPRVCIV